VSKCIHTVGFVGIQWNGHTHLVVWRRHAALAGLLVDVDVAVLAVIPAGDPRVGDLWLLLLLLLLLIVAGVVALVGKRVNEG
jgi:hypothetical protein